METLFQDLRYGARMLTKSPGFTLTAVFALVIGIGANSAIFSVINSALLSPLPFNQSDRLMALNETSPQEGSDRYGVSYPNFVEWRDQNHSFEQVAAILRTGMTLTGGDEPEQISTAFVSSNLFDLLKVSPAFGRSFLPDEDKPGANPVVVMSHRVWARQFGSDPAIVGQTVTLDGRACALIGVMPRGFSFPNEETGLWLPLGPLANIPPMKNRAVHFLSVFGRLNPGVSPQEARSDFEVITANIQQQYPGADPGHGIRVTSLKDDIVGDSRTALLILFGAVGFVLLIATANVANLLLARAASRQKETAIRIALGASRWRIVRQLLTESVLLALVSGGLGLLVALWGVDLLVANFPDYLPRAKEIGVDRYAFVFTLAVSILTGLIFGLAPAVQSSKPDLNEALKDGGKAAKSNIRHLTRSVMVISEVALSLVLVICAGLMIKSFWQVTQVNPGFQAENMLTMTVSASGRRYEKAEPVIAFYKQLTERLEALPGVRAASATSELPVSGGDSNGALTIEGRPFDPGEAPGASFRRVRPNYFQTMGIPLLEGRQFDERDNGDLMVVIINREMARRYFPSGDAIGKRIKIGPPENEPWLTVVGVVGDVKNTGLDAEPKLATYEPHAQRPRGTMTLIARTEVDPMSLAETMRSEIRAMDKDLPIYNVSTMEKRLSASVSPRRFNMMLLGVFALAALILAVIGVYGLMSYTVTERTREIGIRMALGANRSDVLRLVVRQGMTLAAIGVGIGFVGALILTRVLKSLLYGVSATDPTTFVIVSLALAAAALGACFIPARKATKVDPMIALRYE